MQIDLSISAIMLMLLPFADAGMEERANIPEDFPLFVVPGQEKEMQSLRELYFMHYEAAGPLATLWDECRSND